ncbi:hypothetical protein GLOTRDRAFT_138603 [Gloeophyllum trabeum ATCC 11539]|uniref:Amidohydrolase 3 domain-containing protein n=1 Tax=Gloeophyllum trabeum (strain ATCC 11539 / FP-39264 / Madison 617) TaxID=670483 RepID=S7Q8I6_GLOTA|nr:uncharacterized protein GLOTRDRAFT_138603 [Gloeophyllum trabeum ATCC 11539]EPQ55837.1 hypothetical protein GLOTRDRAFT_138603 [Gloeophyllum trabeum ATCC 11539]
MSSSSKDVKLAVPGSRPSAYSYFNPKWPTFLTAVAAAFALYIVSGWRKGLVTQLPQSYALCASRGKGTIYTVDESNPQVECLLVQGDKIMDAGDKDKVRESWAALSLVHAPGDEASLAVLEVPKGHIVVPGLADPHAHILEYGFKMQLQLDGARSLQDIIDILESYVLAHPDVLNDTSKWIEGMGWDQNLWKDWRGGFPMAKDLDTPLLQGRPISIARVDVHATWVSERVLDIMGGLPERVDGGEIIRDREGDPTGVFVDNAMSLIPSPPRSDAVMLEYFDRAMQDGLSVGLTSIHDAGNDARVVRFYEHLAEQGRLPMRLYIMGMLENAQLKMQRRENFGKEGRLNVRGIKMFMDGALGSWGAALIEPYSDKPDTSGLLRIDPQEMRRDVKNAWEQGWQVNIHCIGDRANKIALDIFEEVLRDAQGNASVRRPRIEHAQIMQSSDLERTGKLGVIASVQPTHATSDMWYAESRLGPERIKGAYAYQTLLRNSPEGVLPLGSDFPVESINPLLGFYAAVSRLDRSGRSPHGENGWFAKERLTRAQALKGMTLDAAYASFAEHDIGSLAPGKKADFVVLNKDIMSVPVHEILTTRVAATVIDGRIAFGGL